MNKAKQQTRTPRVAPLDADNSQPIQLSVLVLQADALELDDAVRQELKQHGFVVKRQALVHLSSETARQFVFEVCNSHSAMYRPSAEQTNDGIFTGGEGSGRVHEPTLDQTTNSWGTAEDFEIAEHAVQALISGPALVLGVEKPNAVADLLQIVGPAHSKAWTEGFSSCLRARFAKDAPRKLGLRCSTQATTAAHELDFLLKYSDIKVHTQRLEHAAAMPLSVTGSASASMSLLQLLSFLFPAHMQHPDSAGRLFVFGMYGPLDAQLRLRSGNKGTHIVTDSELRTMALRIKREDILAVYGLYSMSQEEEEVVISQVDHLLNRFPQYTPRDIEALFASLQRDSDGNMLFHDMQLVVLKERQRRVVCMKKRLHPELAKPVGNPFSRTLTRAAATKGAALVNGAPSSFFRKDVGVTDAENAALVSRLLSTHAFQICQMEDGNSPALTQNVRLIRSEICPRRTMNSNCQKCIPKILK